MKYSARDFQKTFVFNISIRDFNEKKKRSAEKINEDRNITQFLS